MENPVGRGRRGCAGVLVDRRSRRVPRVRRSRRCGTRRLPRQRRHHARDTDRDDCRVVGVAAARFAKNLKGMTVTASMGLRSPSDWSVGILVVCGVLACTPAPSVSDADAGGDAARDVESDESQTADTGARGVSDPWRGAQRPVPFADINPDPRIIEVALEASWGEWEIEPGRRVRAMTYNGGVPGPTLEGTVGDQVIVHFRNSLDQPTTIHWHGLRVPADMDGTHFVHHAIEPGATFDYRFELLDAGTFWYHPHVSVALQVEMGLYGAIVVHGPSEPPVDWDGVVVVDDLRLDAAGAIEPESMDDILPGRTGPRMIVNGRVGPTFAARAGATYRLRIVNAANARYFRLAMTGHTWQLIGFDGALLERAETVDDVLVVPGQRVELAWTAPARLDGGATVRTLAYDRGPGSDVAPFDVMRVELLPDPPLDVRALPARLNSLAALDTAGATQRVIRLGQIAGPGSAVQFTINGASYPDVPTIVATLGGTEIWEINNETSADHPFHIHGFSFQLLSRNGVAPSRVSFHDTINVPARDTLRIAWRAERYPGMWMYHCHILEHAEHGMLGVLEVR